MASVQKLTWVVVVAGLIGILYLAFRGYLVPGLLLDFANRMLC